jgi:hypothetical protein
MDSGKFGNWVALRDWQGFPSLWVWLQTGKVDFHASIGQKRPG